MDDSSARRRHLNPPKEIDEAKREPTWAFIGYNGSMSLLAPTPPDRMVDARGRPYFLWDEDLTIDTFRARLMDPDLEVRAYYVGKLMRQAKPDDVFTFVTLGEIKTLFPLVVRYLGRSREFWTWLLGRWNALPDVTK
jgi:hypothetical protein